MEAKRVGILVYDDFMALDVAGPMDAFTTAMIEQSSGRLAPAYEVLTIGLTSQPVVAESGLLLKPHRTIRNTPSLDTLIIPGGRGLRRTEAAAKASAWLKSCASRIRRIASVCTGIYALAPTGLLDGRRVTTHWRFAQDAARRFPKLKINPDALFIKDGSFYTSAGVTAGIDLSLALIEEDCGPQVALAVARELVVFLKRPGGQEQYSEPLQFQMQSADPLSNLTAWMTGHLDKDLTVESLAEKAALCPRQFNRRFKNAFNTTPAAFVRELRLAEARRRLSSRNQTIEAVAASTGFQSDDAFRRAFERRFGVAPGVYRRHFTVSPRGKVMKRA